MKNTLTLIPLIICFSLLTGYNFMAAQWTAAPASAPNNNTATPINVGTTTQAKNGNLAANVLAATTETRTNRYCDSLGANCWSHASATAAITGGGGGVGTWGTWTNVTASRVGRVWYHNNAPTGRVVHYNTSYGAPQVYVSPTGSGTDDVIVSSQDGDSGEWGPGSFIVPPGHYYYFGNTTAFRIVSELQLPF